MLQTDYWKENSCSSLNRDTGCPLFMRQLRFWGGPSIVLNVLQEGKKKDKNHVSEISGDNIMCCETFFVITGDMSLSYHKRRTELGGVCDGKRGRKLWHSCWLIVVDRKQVKM